MIKVLALQDSHIVELWKMIKDTDYFVDDSGVETIDDFKNYLSKMTEPRVGMKDDEVVGCAYLERLYNGLGCISIFTKRRILKPIELVEILSTGMKYYFNKYNLKMLYAVIRSNNKACLRLVQKVGFIISDRLKDHETVKGIKYDNILVTLMRGKLENI